MSAAARISLSSDPDKDQILEYSGVFTRDILSSIWTLAKQYLEEAAEDSIKAKKQLLSLVELSQNVSFHSLGQKGSILLQALEEDSISIEVQNEVSLEQMELISCHLEMLKNSSKEKLKEMYQKKIQEKMTKNTAGLGLIDVFKFSDQIVYNFVENKNSYTYLFKVII